MEQDKAIYQELLGNSIHMALMLEHPMALPLHHVVNIVSDLIMRIGFTKEVPIFGIVSILAQVNIILRSLLVYDIRRRNGTFIERY
jgi:hypothetical protein